MTNFKKLIADDIQKSAFDAYPHGIIVASRLSDRDVMLNREKCDAYKAGAQRYANLLEKALDALDNIATPFNGNAFRTPQDYADRAVRMQEIAWHCRKQITAELTNKDKE